ncbi:GMC oxidoreductase-domain-containing protein [Cyathus striatus]|nr:GMC oxidoreductase-domain-containing protein [Cyathus striatus]
MLPRVAYLEFIVLVLEAGPSNEGIVDIDAPGLAYNLQKSPFDWNFTTVPQAALNNRSLAYTRGHVLGGSSSINGMFYTRGSSDDYNRWATITRDKGWSWNEIFPFILRNEHFTSPADGHSTAGQFDPAFHNFTGNTFVTLPGYSELLDETYIQATNNASGEVPFNLDTNSGWLQTTIGNGTRSSAASSYLGPQFINHPNLDVVLNTQISHVLTSGNGSKVDFRTVEFRSGTNDSTLRTVTAHKELILSLGSIGTPHILLNSGVGDETELKEIGIKPILHLPGIGKNLLDQPYVYPNWFVNLTVMPVNATEALNQCLETRTGPLINTPLANQVAWGRVPETSSIFQNVSDPAAGPHTPHFEFVLQRYPEALSSSESTLLMGVVLVTPASRGSVSLKSNNPFDVPLIDPAYFKDDIDLLIMKEAIASAVRFFTGPTWKDIILGPQGGFANVMDDLSLIQFICENADTGLHAVGTAAIIRKIFISLISKIRTF